MAARRAKTKRPERRFFVVSVRRETPDLRKLSKALLAVVLDEQQRQASEAEEGSTG